MEALQLLMWPLLACIAIVAIHAYLGFHVVERGVIFVDLALAQVAALGATVGFLMGFDLHSPASGWFSIAAVVVGAGNLLAASPGEVARLAALYIGIGVLHFLWRRPFFAISRGETAGMTRTQVRLWDFLFYLTFGLVVTQSVAVAGVLLVFSYLIVPSVIAMLLADGARIRLAIGWITGVIVSVAGMLASYHFDLPTGATVVTTFGAALALAVAWRGLVRRETPEDALDEPAPGETWRPRGA
jgi:zinc/manganese transport system permease protein